MKSLSLSLVVLLLSLSTTSAFLVIKFGSRCPQTPIKQDFDITRYLGKWWEYQRFPAPFEFAGTCSSANYTLIASDRVKVVNAGIQKLKIFNWVIARKPLLAIGEAVAVAPGKLRVSFPQSPSMGDEPNYFVVDTDYDNYTVVFSCTDFFIGNFQFLWILTRAQGVRPPNLDALHQTLKGSGIDLGPLITVDQQDCRL